MSIVKGKKINPDGSLREMKSRHTDDTGKSWPKGTLYQPYSSGMAGGYEYQEVLIKGEAVRFTNNIGYDL